MATITMERKALLQALRVMAAVTPRKSDIPALSNVKLHANGDVKLSATDLEYGAHASVQRIGGRGDVTLALPVARLIAMIRAGTSEAVELATDSLPGRETVVTVDKAAKIVGIDPADMPALPVLDKGAVVAQFDAAALAEAFNNTVYARSSEVVRYALTGVLLDVNAATKRANMVASDGKRLMSWKLSPRYVTVRGTARVIVPHKPLATLATLAGKTKEPIELRVQAEGDVTRATFTVGKSGIYTRLIEGHFPDYEAVTPSNLPPAWVLNRAELIEALETVMPVLTDKTCAVRFSFRPGKVTLFARSADVGEATARAGCEGSNPEADVVLNPEFILEYLKALPKDVRYVKAQVKDKTAATLWQATASDKYVVMPLTINL